MGTVVAGREKHSALNHFASARCFNLKFYELQMKIVSHCAAESSMNLRKYVFFCFAILIPAEKESFPLRSLFHSSLPPAIYDRHKFQCFFYAV